VCDADAELRESTIDVLSARGGPDLAFYGFPSKQWTASASDLSWRRSTQQTHSLQNEIEFAKVRFMPLCRENRGRLLPLRAREGANVPQPTSYGYGRQAAIAAAHVRAL